ncbi:hypothetical protein MCOR27_010422 [Pyricularia oryzae]|uniref:Phospholipid/glycerol acyltransferase domain-containing protein n=2 Tax=Pyricularia TaxID=48558 RepID=A0ABQ8NBG4_PYRGI|nr:hypothetical protein MCOR01_005660 [Pyricularia oryzae]KAI6294426.1 hypothetical protein MCOR33_008437 [Pyricularia grisea]KAH9434871.1 hypothetical protein MCOR02_003835 [Pyricularia oryzae]KAI6255161.1 hypothetical protein MCOR19_008328 [Pyricularia oryzae]KAI6264064.1 hypothetical protein MCOR26_011615 [Pyricularia oryzae]
MEKFSQFRDRGSGISPFMPISTPSGSFLWVLAHTGIFLVRLPLFIAYMVVYFTILHYLPFPSGVRKILLWITMGIPGIWWVDLQLDGVKRGKVSQQSDKLPKAPCVIAANFTSPIDALYLAAVFNPVFTISYPSSRKVRHVGLPRMFLHALGRSQLTQEPDPRSLTDVAELLRKYPGRIVVVFPECGTTNGRGILPLAPSLASVPADTGIYPVSIRYTAPDITTPVPGLWGSFLWKLLSRPRHCIRVRIAEVQHNGAAAVKNGSSSNGGTADAGPNDLTPEEHQTLDKVAEALARLGRNKRVGLTVQDKTAFVQLWKKSKGWF